METSAISLALDSAGIRTCEAAVAMDLMWSDMRALRDGRRLPSVDELVALGDITGHDLSDLPVCSDALSVFEISERGGAVPAWVLGELRHFEMPAGRMATAETYGVLADMLLSTSRLAAPLSVHFRTDVPGTLMRASNFRHL